ncbi:MAG TPA: zf-HC2 domain-containing protein [Candidatus Eisenbacteria bacterium]|nr:zf-HC2 domain-containing protein [Candidatus Eisenbacteria bacterium]
MNWTCDLLEARLSDYLDGLLQGPERAEFEAHAKSCPDCAPLLASVRSLVGEMHAMEDLEAPPRLIYAILDKTLGPRETVTGWQAFLNLIRGMATPKFAYGAASVLATLVILASSLGFSFRNPKLADLQPTTIYRNADRQAHLVYARSVKYVSDLRVVYEIQSRLRQDENNLQTTPEDALPKSVPEKAPGQTDDRKPSQPRQQNRANEAGHPLEMLAAGFPVFCERSVR